MIKKMIFIKTVIITIFSSVAFGQIYVGGGLTGLYGVNSPKSFYGLNALIEFPQGEETAFYGKLTYQFSQKSDEFQYDYLEPKNPINYAKGFEFKSSMDYLMLEVGDKWFFRGSYDEGLDGYFAYNGLICMNTIKKDYLSSNYNISDYISPPLRGSVFTIGVGAGLGIKYTVQSIDYTFFSEIGVSFLLVELFTPNETAVDGLEVFNNDMNLSFSIGVRKFLR
jgi:hypothetical protein